MTNVPNIANLETRIPALHSDEALMLRYCDGDFIAFRELYQRHSVGLYRFIAWRSPRQDWVDEIIQDSWIALHKSRSTYQVKAQFRTFLYQIARNRLIDLLRQHPVLLASEIASSDRHANVFEELQVDEAQTLTPEQNMMLQQEHQHLHRAIAELPSEQKEALVLQQFNDLSLEEIAQISEVSIETIKSRLRYAMNKLRHHFQVHKPNQTRQEVNL